MPPSEASDTKLDLRLELIQTRIDAGFKRLEEKFDQTQEELKKIETKATELEKRVVELEKSDAAEKAKLAVLMGMAGLGGSGVGVLASWLMK